MEGKMQQYRCMCVRGKRFRLLFPFDVHRSTAERPYSAFLSSKLKLCLILARTTQQPASGIG